MLRRRDLDLVVPALALAEAAYLIGTRLGPGNEAAVVRGLAGFGIESPLVGDWTLVPDLLQRHADFPLGRTDASFAVLADRLATGLMITVDRRHFGAIRPPRCRTFRLLPEPAAVHEAPAAYATPGEQP